VSRYPKGWALTCEALLKLLLNPITPQLTTDIGPEQDVDDSSFGVGFTPLTTCKNVPRDPFPDIKDVKSWVGECLKAADARHNGRISQYVQGRLSEQAQQALIAYMHS
jgi:exportin-2 (importin alpha re-exporter)